MLGDARGIVRTGGKNVLATGGGGIAIVDDDRDAVVLVENGIPDSRRQSVVPEATVAHDRDCPLVPCLEGRGPRCSQTIAHGRIADVEGRQDRKELAANVGRNVKLPEFTLQKFHGRKKDRKSTRLNSSQ